MAKITGIGGVFFKSRNDSAALAEWYQKHLGMPLESWGGADEAEPEEFILHPSAFILAFQRLRVNSTDAALIISKVQRSRVSFD